MTNEDQTQDNEASAPALDPTCDCPNCLEKQLQADRFLYAIGLGSLILISAAGYVHLVRASLFGWLRF